MAEPWLDLTTEAPQRVTVRVDGAPHELPWLDDLSINQRRRLARSWERLREIDGQEGDLTAADEAERQALLCSAVGLLLPGLDAQLVERLRAEQQEAVLTLFFGRRLAITVARELMSRPLPALPVTEVEAQPTGAS